MRSCVLYLYVFSALMMDRDESFLRDTSCLRFRPELGVFCGLDSVKGGTWLAIDLKGNWL